MDLVALVSGVVELALSFVLGLLTAYGSFRLFAWTTRDLDEMAELKENNAAVGVLLASMLVACAMIVRRAIYPAISSLQTALYDGLGWIALAKVGGLVLIYVGLALGCAVLCVIASMRLFLRLTHDLDEMAEIRRSNVAVALTLGAVIVVTGLFLSQGVQSFLSALIPYPAVEQIQIMGLN